MADAMMHACTAALAQKRCLARLAHAARKRVRGLAALPDSSKQFFGARSQDIFV
jgi:hypothetical protein